MMLILQRKWEIFLSTNKFKQFAIALKTMMQRDKIAEALLELGFSTQDLHSIFQEILSEEHHELITYELSSTVSARVFSPWEQLFLAPEAQRFLLAALHTGVITPLELEQTLAILGVQTPGFTDLEEVRTTLEEVVQDDLRMAILWDINLENVH